MKFLIYSYLAFGARIVGYIHSILPTEGEAFEAIFFGVNSTDTVTVEEKMTNFVAVLFTVRCAVIAYRNNFIIGVDENCSNLSSVTGSSFSDNLGHLHKHSMS
jgi:hypothetical protein